MSEPDAELTCPRCREVLKMLIAHKHELEAARANLDDVYERVNDACNYVHTMAMVLRGEPVL